VPDLPAVAYPLHVTSGGTTATAVTPDSVEQLIRQLLFTSPGERLNRPTLGCGVLELVFDSLSDELRTATQFQIQSNLQQWLGALVRVGSVSATAVGSTLDVTIEYQLADESQPRAVAFRR
jgi:phage baseplate assembly protein W